MSFRQLTKVNLFWIWENPRLVHNKWSHLSILNKMESKWFRKETWISFVLMKWESKKVQWMKINLICATAVVELILQTMTVCLQTNNSIGVTFAISIFVTNVRKRVSNYKTNTEFTSLSFIRQSCLYAIQSWLRKIAVFNSIKRNFNYLLSRCQGTTTTFSSIFNLQKTC